MIADRNDASSAVTPQGPGPVETPIPTDPPTPIAHTWEGEPDLAETLDAEGVEVALDHLDLEGVGRALDVGCGSGTAAVAVARRLGPDREVVATDVDPGALSAARERVAAAGVAVTVRDAALLALPAAGLGTFELVWAAFVVHGMPDQVLALRALRAVVAPGGELALGEGGPPPSFLPWDVGVGEPGLGGRLQAARSAWFAGFRRALPGSVRAPYGWPALLRQAGFRYAGARTTLVERSDPLDEETRVHVRAVLARMLHDRFVPYLDPSDRDTLSSLTEPGGRHDVASRDDLHVLVGRTVHLGRVDG